MVIVHHVGDDVEQNKQMCAQFEKTIEKLLSPNKRVNVNLAQIDSGYVSKVFKGSVDEVNNSLLETYGDHKQYHPLKIRGKLERNIDLKIVRSVRIILTLVSRTPYRASVKSALKDGTFLQRLEVLSKVDLTTVKDFGKKDDESDVMKKIAFQIGQVLGLLEVKEYYSKEDIGKAFSNLKPYLMRESKDKTLLQEELVRFTQRLLENYPKMGQKKE